MKRLTLGFLLLMLMVPGLAFAETAYTTGNVNLRTGPDSGYPPIVTLPSGVRVEIYGCVDDWAWCDVDTGRERGWVSSSFLNYDYQGSRVRVYDYGPQLGLPIVTFMLGAYWDSHYRNRQWYRDRSRWNNYRPAYRPPYRPQQHRPSMGHRPSTGHRPPTSGHRPSTGHRPPTSGHRPSTGQRPPTSGHRPPTGQRPPTSGHRPPTGQRPPTSGHRPPTGQRPPTSGHRPPTSGQRPATRPAAPGRARPSMPAKTRPAAPAKAKPAIKKAAQDKRHR